MQLYRFACRRGLFSHWSPTSAGAIDLHTLPAAVAKVALAVALDEVQALVMRWHIRISPLNH